MTNKSKTIILIIICSLVTFFITLLITNTRDNKPTIKQEETIIPEIKEDFTNVTFKPIKKYDEYLNYDNINNEIYYYDNENYKYIIGSYGKIYNTPILDITPNNYTTNKYNYYTIEYDNKENKYFFVNTKKSTISDLYLNITAICHNENNKNCEYFILQTEKYNYLIYNTYTEEITSELNNISKINGGLIENENYIPTCKYLDNKYQNESCGLIDYKGNTIIDFTYESIEEITNSTYIVSKNNKYGMINTKNEILVPIDNDYYKDTDNYIIFTKNKLLSVFSKSGKMIVDYTIPITPNNSCNSYEDNVGYSYEEINTQLYIITFPECSYNDTLTTYNQVSNKYLKTYLINNNKLEKIVNNKLHPLYEYDNKNNNNYNLKYFYAENIKDKKITITIYDLDLYEYYKFTPNYKDNISNYNINNTETNKNYYKIQINNNNNSTYFYIDLLNSREITEKDALYKYLDNGYGFINDYKTIRIYKNDELIQEFEDTYTYIGNYYFIKDNFVYELIFEK